MADPKTTVCASCGASGDLHEHHLIPRSEGGKTLPTVMLCLPCHGLVHGRSFATNHAELTRRGLAAAKAAIAKDGSWISGRTGQTITKLGNPHLKPGDRFAARAARQVRTARSHAHAADVLPYIEAARKAGCATPSDIARALTARGIETSAGGFTWNTTQVRRVLQRIGPGSPPG